MSSPAKQARLAAAANGFTEVISRGNNFIVTKNPTNGKCSIDAGIGGGWHYGDGQETDTAWEPGIAPWNWQMLQANYNLFALANFKSGQIIKYNIPGANESVTFQPMSLKWTNQINQIQQISFPQDSTVEVLDDKLVWANAYGEGRHFSYIAGPVRLQKLLTIEDPLPATNYNILELEFIMAPSKGVEIIINGEVWDKKTRYDTADEVYFRAPGGAVLWAFSVPTIFDSAGNEATGTLRLRKSGKSLYCAIRFDKTWIDEAVYPIYLDPTIDCQVGAGADDGYWYGSSMSTSGTYLLLGSRYSTLITMFCRWTGITIPDDATIDEAYLSVYYNSKNLDGANTCRIYFEKAASPNQISTPTDGSGRTKTTAYVEWLPPGSGDWSNTPDITSIIEELRASYTYNSGVMQCLVTGDTSTNNYTNIRSYNYTGNVYGPKLHIVYSESSPYVALAGAIITSSGLAASSSVLRALSGVVASKSGLLGATSVSRYLAGVVLTKSGLQGALGKQIQVAGQVVTSTTLAGALTLSQIIALAGQIITQTTLAGAASVSRALAGQVATASTLAGVPSIARSLAGQISTITASASAPSCIRGLVGAISTESSLHAASSVAKALSGAVVTASGLSAVPSVLRGMVGQVATSSCLTGVPSVARALAGQIITTSGLSGSASTLKALAGVVITSSGLTGALTVVGQGIVALSGAIVTVSSLAGSVAVQKALQGQVITQSALSGTASVIRGLVGQVITATSLTGSGRVAIALSGVASTVTGLQGALTIAYENVIELAGQVITATGITSALSTIRGLQGQVVTSSGLSGAASLSLALAGQVVTSVAADCSASVSIALAGAISTVTTITGHLIDVFQRVKKAARIDSLMTVYARIDSVVKRFGRF